MTTITPDKQTPTAFYEQTGVDYAEAQRLEFMATYADFVSLESLSEVTDRQDSVCVDIGAGDSTMLGTRITERNETAHYLPVDMREEAVQRHLAAGFDAKLGYVTDLPFKDNIADALHARFTFGWLDPVGRTRAFEEMLRVGNNQAKMAIIDYDWSTARGPEPVNKLINKVTGIMSSFGFDPYYGSKAAQEMNDNLAEYGYNSEAAEVETNRTNIQETLGRAFDTIVLTSQPVIDKLRGAGLIEDADELAGLLDAVCEYVTDHPDEIMQFPDIVTVTAKLQSEIVHEEALARIHTIRAMGSELLKQESMISVGPTVLDTYRLPQSMQLQARRLHARAYRNHNYITEDGLNPNGTLIEEIDPQSIVDRSTYFGAVNGEGTVTGCIRIIEQENGDLNTLPTIAKTKEALGEDNLLLKSLPFMQPGKITNEASGLGKSVESKDPQVLPKLLLATWLEAKANGTDYMVMTIVDGTARLLTAGFGEKAFRRIDGDTAVVKLTGKGINPKGVTLVPFYVHIDSFIENCKSHFAKRPDSDFVKAALPLFEAAEAFVRTAA